MKRKSSLVSLGICFHLTLGLISGCQTNSSPITSSTEKVQTQNKLTHQNPQLKLSFTYPRGYQVEEFEQSVSVWKNTDYQNKEDFVAVTPLTISIRENPDNLSPMEWVQRRVFLIEGEVTQKLVASEEAVDFQWSGMWLYRSVIVSHREQNQLIMITLDQHVTGYQAVFDQIVATLELL
ncbi:MAG: hypothetical protein QNJ60_09780 [Xenococcaceae cyanobacterium MO_188.B19]|nr:hypothetical protein [Xenococcaceae cyanobacterium MO_188.B19]